MSAAPKLMFVVNVDWFFLSHRLPIALEARRQGFEVHIATGLTNRLDDLEKAGLVVHPLVLDRSSASIGNAVATIRQLVQAFRHVRPDVVHLVTIKPVLLGGLAARLARIPAVVAAVSGLGFVFMAQGLRAALRRSVVGAMYRVALNHRNAKVIFQNEEDRASLVRITGLAQAKTTLIRGSGVDLVSYRCTPEPSGIPVILLAARLLADKGVREFVQAARLLRKRSCAVRMVLVGTADPANPTSVAAEDLAKWVQEGLVEHWGHRSDMPAVLASANVVVLPSYREGLPKVLAEAAACGRAVITTDVPGCRDAVEANVTGLLVPPRNAAALADAIALLAEDQAMRCRMGMAGRQLAESAFDVQQVIAAHMGIYRELMNT